MFLYFHLLAKFLTHPYHKGELIVNTPFAPFFADKKYKGRDVNVNLIKPFAFPPESTTI